MSSRRTVRFSMVTLLAICGGLPAVGQDVATLRQKGDVDGLVALLRHSDGQVRGQAAVALSNVVEDEKDVEVLTNVLNKLVDAALKDTHATVREYSGRAVQRSIQRVSLPAILRGAATRMLDALPAGEVEERRRRFAAVRLSGLMPRIKHTPLLEASVPTLLAATLDDPHPEVREYAGRALKSVLMRIENDDLLHTGVVTLTRTLRHEDLKRRRYAATLLSGAVARIERRQTHQHIAKALRESAANDKDETVREYAGRASRHVDSALKQAVAKSNN